MHAEASYRSTCDNLHKWRIEWRANRLEELLVSRLKAEQAERDRIEQVKQENVARLAGEADAFRKAQMIRSYVAAARERSNTQSGDQFEKWAEWALGVAAGIDPLQGNAFLANLARRRILSCWGGSLAGYAAAPRASSPAP